MNQKKHSIYLDHAAATPVRPEVMKVMAPFWSNQFHNPSSIGSGGLVARAAIEESRATIARLLGMHTDEVIFTGSGTESTNLAVTGLVGSSDHLIVSAIEHHAVLEPARQFANRGGSLTVVPVDQTGIIDVATLETALQPTTRLVSIMAVNNEIGTLQPLAQIARLVRRINRQRLQAGAQTIILHTDACQASGFLDLAELMKQVDVLSLNAAKIGGPKGIGALIIRRGLQLQPLILGGDQEAGRRAGTESVPLIVGFAKALSLAQSEHVAESGRVTKLRDELLRALRADQPQLIVNGHPTNRVANNLNVTIPGIEAEPLQIYLDQDGVTIGTGAACDSRTLTPSHVLKALGMSDQQALSTIRLTLGRTTSSADIRQAAAVMLQRIAWFKNQRL